MKVFHFNKCEGGTLNCRDQRHFEQSRRENWKKFDFEVKQEVEISDSFLKSWLH